MLLKSAFLSWVQTACSPAVAPYSRTVVAAAIAAFMLLPLLPLHCFNHPTKPPIAQVHKGMGHCKWAPGPHNGTSHHAWLQPHDGHMGEMAGVISSLFKFAPACQPSTTVQEANLVPARHCCLWCVPAADPLRSVQCTGHAFAVSHCAHLC